MIPYVMDDTKTLAELVADTSNGLGRLAECMSLDITEALNGEYVGTMVIPKEAYNSGLVHRGGIIKAKANESDSPQLFRVVKFKETLSSGLIECDLEHISYDLNKQIIRTPLRVSGNTVSWILSAFNGTASFVTVAPTGIFTAASNVSGTVRTWYIEPPPKSIRQALLGEEGVCVRQGWQMHWDNLTYEMRDRRGTDKTDSVIVSYGKNVMDFSNEQDITSVYDGIQGYVYAPSKWEQAVYGALRPIRAGTTPENILLMDFTKHADDLGFTNSPPASWQVTSWTDNWIAANDPTVPLVALDIDLASLEATGEYQQLKELEKIELGDTITVKIGEVSVNANVTEVTYDSLSERYTEIKLGNYRPSLADTILGLVGQNTTALSNTQQEYNSTFQSMKTTMLFDTYQTNPSTDWNTERYNEYKIEGNGFIIIMVNAYTAGTDSYGNIEASVRHSTDSGTTWGYDAYTKYRHDQSISDSYDGTAITVPMAVTDEELIRATWKITKEVGKACRIKILGIGVTATQTVDGGAL